MLGTLVTLVSIVIVIQMIHLFVAIYKAKRIGLLVELTAEQVDLLNEQTEIMRELNLDDEEMEDDEYHGETVEETAPDNRL